MNRIRPNSSASSSCCPSGRPWASHPRPLCPSLAPGRRLRPCLQLQRHRLVSQQAVVLSKLTTPFFFSNPDKLISSFTHDVNYHYYIVYPPLFLRHYHIWWDRRSENRSITFQFTCLLAMICSCCIQHADDLTQQALERETRQSAESLSELLHNAVRELASVIPVGHYHMFNVQRLLHSCYWYKAEARFLEAWHVLSAAILEAKELGRLLLSPLVLFYYFISFLVFFLPFSFLACPAPR